MSAGQQALQKAYNYEEMSYQDIDCSHLVHQAFKDAGYQYAYLQTDKLPNSPAFKSVPLSEAQTGDVILFPGHMGFIVNCAYNNGQLSGAFFGSQTSSGPAKVNFGPNAAYWGKTKKVIGVYRKK